MTLTPRFPADLRGVLLLHAADFWSRVEDNDRRAAMESFEKICELLANAEHGREEAKRTLKNILRCGVKVG